MSSRASSSGCDFDLQDNRSAVQLMLDLDPVFIAFPARYDYYCWNRQLPAGSHRAT
jgi:hypothetical protein